MLRKKKKQREATEAQESAELQQKPPVADIGDTGERELELDAPQVDRSGGPFDLAEVAEPDAMAAERLDLGALQLPLLDGLEVRVEIDPDTNQPAAITIIRGEGAVQVRAFAAPKSGGSWDEARTEIRSSISGDGGIVDEVVGVFGAELHTTAYVPDEQGKPVAQRMRFVGIDGPRWMVQAVMLGAGSVPEQAGELEEVLRSLVVVRGDAPMPPGSPLQLTLPEQVPGQLDEIDEDDEG